MKAIKTLLNMHPIPEASEIIITTDGYGIWFAWEGELNPHVVQIFQDYGGLFVTELEGQALWFFFSTDVIFALAKVSTWVKYNSMAGIMQVMPATLHIDMTKQPLLEIEPEYRGQSVSKLSRGLYCLLPEALKKLGQNIPGLTFTASEMIAEEAESIFTESVPKSLYKLTVDPKLPYSSPAGWYAILHPLGSPFDKQFQQGWRSMFAIFEAVIQKNRLKYSLHDNFLVVFLDHFSQLRTWTDDILSIIFELKDTRSADYWPCVNAIVDRKGLSFSHDLPSKLPIKWDKLSPDLIHMSYRNAYPLGSAFSVQDMYFTSGTSSIENMCTVTLSARDLFSTKVPVLLPGQFVNGSDIPCFYCGIKSHNPSECPSRKMKESDPNFWQNFNDVDIDTINLAFRNIELGLSSAGLSTFETMIQSNTGEARVAEAVFQANPFAQVRVIERIWQLFDKNMSALPASNYVKDDSMAWKLLQNFLGARVEELPLFEKNALQFANENQRDWKIKSLLGFVALERGDYDKAMYYWKAAESNCSTTLHQAWHFFLQARLLEITGKYAEAYEIYDDTKKLLPEWNEPNYRKYVCKIKLAKTDEVIPDLIDEIRSNPALFNRVIMDPEFERGQLMILTALYPLWADSLKFSVLEQDALHKNLEELNAWFPNEHIVADTIRVKLQELIRGIAVQNYLASSNITKFRPIIEDEFEQLKNYEIVNLKKLYKAFLTELEGIRDEAAWYPFPRTLIDFNKDFNECASLLNWAFGANFGLPEPFNQAQNSTNTIRELLTRLKNKLKLIRTVRDSTLYGLIFLKTFVWFGLALLSIALILTVVTTIFGASLGFGWLQKLVTQNFWELQRTLIIVIGVTSLGVASLRATFVFEKRRDQMVANAKAAREEMQRQRLEQIKNT